MFHHHISNTLLPHPGWIHCHRSHGGLVAQSRLTLVTLWTVAHKAPLSKGFSRQEYWRGLPFPSPGDLSNLGIKPKSPALQNLYRLSYQWSLPSLWIPVNIRPCTVIRVFNPPYPWVPIPPSQGEETQLQTRYIPVNRCVRPHDRGLRKPTSWHSFHSLSLQKPEGRGYGPGSN